MLLHGDLVPNIVPQTVLAEKIMFVKFELIQRASFNQKRKGRYFGFWTKVRFLRKIVFWPYLLKDRLLHTKFGHQVSFISSYLPTKGFVEKGNWRIEAIF